MPRHLGPQGDPRRRDRHRRRRLRRPLPGGQRIQPRLPPRAPRRLGRLPLRGEVRQARPHPGQPRPPIGPPRRQRLPAEQVLTRLRRSLLIRAGRPGHDRRGQLAQPGLGPVRLLRRIRADLDPVHGQHRQPAQPGRRAHPQHRVKHVLHQPAVTARPPPEPGDRRMIRHQPSARQPERGIHPAPRLDRPGRQHPAAIRIRQQRQQHHRVIRPPAPGALARPARQPRRQLRRSQLLYRVDDQPDNMILRHPVIHIRGQKGRLIPVHRKVPTRHKPSSTRQNTQI